MPETDPILSELKEGVLTITLNRPKANAFNIEMIHAAQKVFRDAARNPKIRTVLLTGAGNVFSAGQDIREVKSAEDQSFRYHLQHTYNPLILQIRQLERPVIAAINGAVAGAGLGVALACDLRIASDQARFVVGFSGIGLACDSAVSLFLPTLLGLGRAAEFTFSNDPISAEQALNWGLVNRVVPSAELQEQAFAWAASLAQGPVKAMGLSKRDFNKAIYPRLEEVLDYEAHIQDIAGKGDEHKEGVQAFLDKRKARYI
jgi:2-(1,2-epoxy-1,2-dihydrophenyl)acetyl-CoA isomerase